MVEIVVVGGGMSWGGVGMQSAQGVSPSFLYYVFPSLAKIKMWKKKDQEYYYKTLLFYWNIFNWIII